MTIGRFIRAAAFAIIALAAMLFDATESFATSSFPSIIPTRAALGGYTSTAAATTLQNVLVTETGFSATYVYNPSSTAIANGTTVIIPSDSPTSGRWLIGISATGGATTGVIGSGLTANVATVVVEPYTVTYPVVTGTGNFGPAPGHISFDMVNVGHQFTIRQSGCDSRFKTYVTSLTNVTGFYLKVWRPNGKQPAFQSGQKTLYSFVGQTSNVVGSMTGNAINTITVSPCIPVEVGDFVGAHVDFSGTNSFQIFTSTTVANTTLGEVGAVNYNMVDANPTSPNFDWAAQSVNSGLVVVIEADENLAPIIASLTDSEGSGYGARNGSFIDPFDNFVNLPGQLVHAVAAPYGYTYQNMGVGGQTYCNMASRVATDIVALHPKVAVNNGGINDLTASESNATIIGCLTTILNAEIADGEVPVVIGVTPFYGATGTIPIMTQRDLLNPLIKTLVTGAPYNGFYISPDALGQYTTDGPAGNLWVLGPLFNSGDTVHFNSVGAGVLARAITSDAVGNLSSPLATFGANVGINTSKSKPPPAPLTVGDVATNAGLNSYIFGSNYSQTTATRIQVGNLAQSNDAVNPFALSVLVTGNSNASLRTVTLQTQQDGGASFAGILSLNPLGGSVKAANLTMTGTTVLGASASATGTFSMANATFLGSLVGGPGGCTNANGDVLAVCANVLSTNTANTPVAAFITKDANGCGALVNYQGAAAIADQVSSISTGCVGVSNNGNLILQPISGTKVGIGTGLSTPTASLEIGRDAKFDSTIVAPSLTAASAGTHAICVNTTTHELVVSGSSTCP